MLLVLLVLLRQHVTLDTPVDVPVKVVFVSSDGNNAGEADNHHVDNDAPFHADTTCFPVIIDAADFAAAVAKELLPSRGKMILRTQLFLFLLIPVFRFSGCPLCC